MPSVRSGKRSSCSSSFEATAPFGRGSRARLPQQFGPAAGALRPFCRTRGPRPRGLAQEDPATSWAVSAAGPGLRQAMRSCSPSGWAPPGEERVLGLCFETSGVRSHGLSLGFQSAKGDLRQNPVSASAQLESNRMKAVGKAGGACARFLGCEGFQRRRRSPFYGISGLVRRRDSLGLQAPARF